MGIKLTLLILLCITCSCQRDKKQQENPFYVKEADYIIAYKTAFMSGCLYETTHGNFYTFLRENNDLGLFTEADLISHATVKKADSLGRLYAKQISPFTYGDGAGKIPGFSRCMELALSKEVDSIAKLAYQQAMRAGE